MWEMVIMNDLHWLNAFILCDLLSKGQKGHAANREDSFKDIQIHVT